MDELLDFIISQANDDEKLFEDNILLTCILLKAKKLKKDLGN